MTTIMFLSTNGQKKNTHAVTKRGAKIIHRLKNDTWYLKRGRGKIALSVQEAACIAVDGYVTLGLEGGAEFDKIVREIWSRSVYKPKKKSQKKKKLSNAAA